MKKFLGVLVAIAIAYAGWRYYAARHAPDVAPSSRREHPNTTHAGDGALPDDAMVQEPTLRDTQADTKPEADDAPDMDPEILSAIKTARESGDERKAISYELRSQISGEHRRRLMAQLTPFTEKLFTPAPTSECAFYTVQAGDNLSKIASKYNIPYPFIMRINGLKNATIKVGQRLKIPIGTISIWVDKSAFWLGVFLDDYCIKGFPVGIGQFDKTPEGTFEIEEKIVDPTWYSPDLGRIESGDPRNELGTRWLGFKDTDALSGYGIHGTIRPETVGKASSQGCIRLLNPDAEDLFDLVPKGCKVTIVE